MKTSIEVSSWFNKLFFDEKDQPKEPVIGIILKHESGTLEIPGVKVRPGHTIGSLIKAYHTFLKQQPRPVEQITTKPATEETPPPMDVGSVEYRGKLYLVEQTDEEAFIVLREDRTPINGKSPTARAVVKRFRAK